MAIFMRVLDRFISMHRILLYTLSIIFYEIYLFTDILRLKLCFKLYKK